MADFILQNPGIILAEAEKNNNIIHSFLFKNMEERLTVRIRDRVSALGKLNDILVPWLYEILWRNEKSK